MSKELNPNKLTIEAYDSSVEEWLAHTPQQYASTSLPWIDEALSFIPKEGRVLEIGSATPRDANYMRAKGYTVQCSDATPHFVQYLEEHGELPLTLNVIEDQIPKGYNMVFANAVVPHFTPSDFARVLEKVFTALEPGGVFVFSAKQGEGDTWIQEKVAQKRYTHYWEPNALASLLKKTGFDIRYLKGDGEGYTSQCTWIVAAAQKPGDEKSSPIEPTAQPLVTRSAL